MSEAERKRRLDYRKIRKKWITWQSMILAAVLLVAIVATVLCIQLDKTHYINYHEQSDIDYGVYLKEDEFYWDYQGSDREYVASQIDKVAAKFQYQIVMDSEEFVDFTYTYRIDAVLRITSAQSGKVLYAPVYTLLPEQTATGSGKGVMIEREVMIDYAQYNDIANRFLEKFELSGMKANVIMQMHVNVIGDSNEFEGNRTSNSYVASLNVPLTTKTVDVQITSSIPAAESKILSYSNSAAAFVFRVIAIVFASVGLLLFLCLIGLIYLTRNTDITYEIRLSRLVKSYKSFIQKINNVFDTAGYQVLLVDTFMEMLEIRDTIQSPILMNENEDKTCTRFLIPTNTKLLYVYELKVDDYDEIYNKPVVEEEQKEDEDPTPTEKIAENTVEIPAAVEVIAPVVEVVEEAVEEPVVEVVEEVVEIVEEPTVEVVEEVIEEPAVEVVEEVIEEPAVEVVEEIVEEPAVETVEDAEDEEAVSQYSGIRRSFMAKLSQSTEEKKQFYSDIKNELLSYRAVKSRTAWGQESFKKGHTHLAKMNMRGKTLCLYLALSPADYADSKYFFTDLSERAQYEAVPMLMKIKSGRGVKHAKELIATVAEQNELVKKPTYEPVDYAPTHQTTEALIEQGLIKDPNGEIARKKAREELVLLEAVSDAALDEALGQPDVILSEIDYVDNAPPATADGVEVIDVVWNQKEKGNTLTQVDPNGVEVADGDIVLIPAKDENDGHDFIRKAAVAHANHKVSPDRVETPLQKIIGVLRRKVQNVIMNAGRND